MTPDKIKSFLFVFFILIGFQTLVFSQNNVESFKTEALKQMKVGRYGEAIDLINKFITAKPTVAKGYNIRGLSYEKRNQLELAVYDFRNARKLAPNDKEINNNLARATKTWYDQLYQKIDGHRREIAIDPSKPVNYLEIGKCYKNLGQWAVAEEWYDEYIKREEPSSDEVIRYSEILAKNNHIEKGEKILKKYVEKFPDDHRLWSRYGYFTLWLGKIKIAIEAFEKALDIRPFFLEAQDGLNIALGKSYTYTVNDTSYWKQAQKGTPEYAIDKYYRMLKKNPSDDDTRFLLIAELQKANRFEEADQQLMQLREKYQGENRWDTLYFANQELKDSVYNAKIAELLIEYEKNPNDKKIILQLSDYYSNLQLFEEGMELFEKYLTNNPNDDDTEFRYKYAQISSWNRDFVTAFDQAEYILDKSPSNLKYQLLYSQLSVWTGQRFDEARSYLTNILNSEPNNFEAVLSMGLLELQQRNYDEAQKYCDISKTIDPDNLDIATLQSRIDFERLRAEEERIFLTLQEGRVIAAGGDCEGSLYKYEEFLSKTEPNRQIKREYAQILVCAKHFDAALGVYNELLEQEYDIDIDVDKAKLYYYMGDSVSALTEFSRLALEKPDDFNIQLLLGDSYLKMREYSKAQDVYEALEEKTTDSTELSLLKMRMGWLPITGFKGFIKNFPSYIILSPDASYYEDNYDLVVNRYGLRAEFGAFSFMSLGAYAGRGSFKADSVSYNYNSIKAGMYFHVKSYFTVGMHWGKRYYRGVDPQNTFDAFIRHTKDSVYSVSLNYQSVDAMDILFSKFFYSNRNTIQFYQLNGFYSIKSGLKFSGNYNFFNISDGNKGETYYFRIGKQFEPDIIGGYEYAGSNFAQTTTNYYSPQGFYSHSIWVDWEAAKEENYTLSFGGKIGLIPSSDFIITEAYGQINYKIVKNFSIFLRGSFSRTVREIVGYQSRSIMFTASWQL